MLHDFMCSEYKIETWVQYIFWQLLRNNLICLQLKQQKIKVKKICLLLYMMDTNLDGSPAGARWAVRSFPEWADHGCTACMLVGNKKHVQRGSWRWRASHNTLKASLIWMFEILRTSGVLMTAFLPLLVIRKQQFHLNSHDNGDWHGGGSRSPSWSQTQRLCLSVAVLCILAPNNLFLALYKLPTWQSED